MFKKLILSFLLLFVFSVNAQLEYVQKVTKELTSPAFAGRGYVFGGDSITANYIASEWKANGIQPLKKSYFQSFNINVNTFPKSTFLGNANNPYTLGKDYLPEAESGSFHGILNVFKLDFHTGEDQKSVLLSLRDAIQSELYNTLYIRTDFSTLTTSEKDFVEAICVNIAQNNCVILQDNRKWNWSVGRKKLNFPFIRVKEDVAISSGMKLDITAVYKDKYVTQNVVGYIPAKVKSKVNIVFTAHYDHLGAIGKAVYFPGASDNASGTASLMAIGKYFVENPVDFNVILIAFSGEEAGLVGSEYFVKNPMFSLNSIRFLVNMDIFGSGETGIAVVNGSVFPNELRILQNINKEHEYLDRIKVRGKAANSDHHFFTEAGVPSFFIYTEGINQNYHDIFDTYEELSFAKTEQLIHLLIEFSKQVAK